MIVIKILNALFSIILGMNLIHPNKRPQRRTFDENLFEDSISFDQDTNFRLHGPGHALTFIFGRNMLGW